MSIYNTGSKRELVENLSGALPYMGKGLRALSESVLRKLDAMTEASRAAGRLKHTLLLARAFLLSALERRESRGAHTRLDYPKTDAALKKNTIVCCADGQIRLSYREIPVLRAQAEDG